jgi:hypothetical protein
MALLASLSLAAAKPATIDVDGQRVNPDVAPVTVGNSAYLPLRAVSDAAGAVTTFDARTGAVVVRSRNTTLHLTVGDRQAQLDGHAITLTHAPFTVHGRVMVRASDIAVALDSAVRYDVRHGSIDVRTPGAVVAGAPDDSP